MAASSVLSFSVDGQYLVHASPSGVIKIWETPTGKLKQEYVPSSHLSASCCCLSWCPWTQKTSLNGHTDRVTGTSWSDDGQTLFTSSADHHIVEWDVPSSSVKHKWKADPGPIHSLCHCPPNHLVTAARSIKLWNLDTYKVLRSFTGHATEVFSLHHTGNSTSIDDTYVISAALDDRLINVWHINLSTKDKSAAASFSLPDDPVMLNVTKSHTKSQTVNMVIVTKSGQVLFYESGLNGRLKSSSFKPQFTIYCATSEDTPIPVPVFAAIPKGDKVLIVHGNLLKPTIELVSKKSDGSDICLIRDSVSVVSNAQSQAASKVKTPKRGDNITVLAPGHMAPSQPITADAAPVKSKRKVSTAQMSIGERLNAISIDKQSTSDATEPPRADTLAVLLTQGLQSNDKDILNNVLQNGNETVIRNTVRRLSVPAVVPLVMELSQRMHGHAQRGYFIEFHISSTVRRLSVPAIVPLVMELSQRMHGHAQSGLILSRWMKTVLAVHTSYLMSLPEIVDICSSMYQMMDCRVNMYTRLSKLQGRLDLVLSQISEQPEGDDNLSKQQPLLVYHEESSDDDDVLEDILHPHSESEDNWDDITDEEDDDMEVG